MRRFITSVAVFLLSAVVSFGEVVSQEQARAKAYSHFSDRKAHPSLKMVWDGLDDTKSYSRSPAFYVFNNDGGGFVIVAGDDIVESVLGYSDSGCFVAENTPANVSSWFGQIADYIEKGRALGVAPRAVTTASKVSEGGVLIETPLWDQKNPFNAKCPVYKNDTCYTGCAATAIAEALWTLKYPAQGSGKVGEYITKTLKISIPAHNLGKYDWNNMPKDNPASWTESNIDAVSQLMYDCGTMLESDYGSRQYEGGTSAYPDYIVAALIKYMAIDSSFVKQRCEWHTTDEWISMLKDEIDNGRPVLYGGWTEKNEGHLFVVDGYDSEDRMHVNFGWGGIDNGYYAYPDFGKKPEYTFPKWHIAFFGLKPFEGGTSDVRLSFSPEDSFVRGLVSDSLTVTPKTEFKIMVDGVILNTYPELYEGEVALARIDAYGEFVELVSDPLSVSFRKNYGMAAFELVCMCSEIHEGDKVVLVSRRLTESSWKQLDCVKNDPDFAWKFDLVMTVTPELIASKTSFLFEKESGIITLTSHQGIECTLKDAQGLEISGVVEIKDNIVTIDTSSLSGVYEVILTIDTVSTSFTIEI